MRRGATAGFCAALVLLSAACSASHSAPSAASSATRIGVSVQSCGTGWTKPKPGQQHFVLADTDTRAGEVLLTDANTGAVYADVEPVSPGATTNLDIELGSGRYAFRCAMEDEATVIGPTVVIAGNVRAGAAPVQAVTRADLIASTKSYQRYVSAQLPTLVRLTSRLAGDLNDGSLAAARTDWLAAHLEYERLGAAYDAFGDLDAAINGLPDGLPGGVHDPNWHGFHRIEYGLWQGEPIASLKLAGRSLSAAVSALGREFAAAQIDPLQISIRAHEITENALQFELTGMTDYGSHSNLATVRANLDGTATVLTIVKALLTARYSQLPAVMDALVSARADLDALVVHGHWPAVTTLGTRQRERVDADISNLSELLAPIASILEPRRPQ